MLTFKRVFVDISLYCIDALYAVKKLAEYVVYATFKMFYEAQH